MEKIQEKLEKWMGMQLNMAGRVIVLKHYILGALVYLSCWKPPKGVTKPFQEIFVANGNLRRMNGQVGFSFIQFK